MMNLWLGAKNSASSQWAKCESHLSLSKYPQAWTSSKFNRMKLLFCCHSNIFIYSVEHIDYAYLPPACLLDSWSGFFPSKCHAVTSEWDFFFKNVVKILVYVINILLYVVKVLVCVVKKSFFISLKPFFYLVKILVYVSDGMNLAV